MYVGKRIDLFKYMLKVHQNKDDNGYITILLIPYSHQKKYLYILSYLTSSNFNSPHVLIEYLYAHTNIHYPHFFV